MAIRSAFGSTLPRIGLANKTVRRSSSRRKIMILVSAAIFCRARRTMIIGTTTSFSATSSTTSYCLWRRQGSTETRMGDGKARSPRQTGRCDAQFQHSYLLSGLCHFGAIFWLFKAVTTYTQRHWQQGDGSGDRWPHAAACRRYRGGAAATAREAALGHLSQCGTAFAAGAAAYWLVPDNVRTWLGGALTAMPLKLLRHVGA